MNRILLGVDATPEETQARCSDGKSKGEDFPAQASVRNIQLTEHRDNRYTRTRILLYICMCVCMCVYRVAGIEILLYAFYSSDV